MAESISYTGLGLALLLPWILGSLWVRILLDGSRGWNLATVLGHGYLLGVFATTLLIRLWDLAGLGLSFAGLASVLLSLCLLGALVLRQRILERPPGTPSSGHPEASWEKIIILLLLVLIGWRLYSVTHEALIKPIYSLDALMNWAPKAVTWFHLDELVDFVHPREWLVQSPETVHYTLGNYHAWSYPETVPLVQLWSMISANSWDHSLLYTPWVLVAFNLGLALYGHLRLAGASVLAASISTYLLLNLPFINVHTALPGYADLWLASAFGMAIFALYQWEQRRDRGYALLFLFNAILCSQLKLPGVVLCTILLLAFVRTLLGASYTTELKISAVLIAILAYGLIFGIHIDLPGERAIALSANALDLPLFGRFEFEYHAISSAMLSTTLSALNWNLTTYMLLLLLATKIYNRDILLRPPSYLLAILGGLVFIVLVYYFTRHYLNALNFTAVNRALLSLVPALIFYIGLNLSSALKQLDGATPHCSSAADGDDAL